jgi:succinate dehydrogenase / fumarate reductase cytochrome b subunit
MNCAYDDGMSSEKINTRPLSPHLQIYKPQMTSMLSILHRATGVALIIGLLLVFAVIIGAATGEQEFNMIMDCVRSPLGQIAIWGWAFSMVYHTFNGIRHLIWDAGYLFKIENATIAGYIVFWGAVLTTAGLWFFG